MNQLATATTITATASRISISLFPRNDGKSFPARLPRTVSATVDSAAAMAMREAIAISPSLTPDDLDPVSVACPLCCAEEDGWALGDECAADDACPPVAGCGEEDACAVGEACAEAVGLC